MRRDADENMVKVGERTVPKSVGDCFQVFFDGEGDTSGLSLTARRLGSERPSDLANMILISWRIVSIRSPIFRLF